MVFSFLKKIACLVFFPFILNSQSAIFSLSEEIEPKGEKQKRSYSDKVISCSNDSAVFYTFSYPDKQSKSIKFNYYHIKNGSTGSYEIFRTGQNKNLFSTRVFSFLIVQQKIIVVTPDEIYSYRIDKGKLLQKNLQKNKKSYKKIYRLNDSICLLYQHYNFHPLDQLEKHVWAHFYNKNDSISDFTNMPETDSKFSQRTNSWLSVYNGLIASSRSSEYFIQFYNPEFELLDSIYTNELDSNKLYMNQLADGGSLESLVGRIKFYCIK